jgi:hypothetical protein
MVAVVDSGHRRYQINLFSFNSGADSHEAIIHVEHL